MNMIHKEEVVAELKRAIEEAGYILRNYSGKGMYGRECLAFQVPQDETDIYAVANVMSCVETKYNVERVARAFKQAVTDSLGMGTIIYFPLISGDKKGNEK